GQQRFRARLQVQVASEVDQQQAVVALSSHGASEEAHYECRFRKDSAVEHAGLLRMKQRLLVAHPDQVAMQPVNLGVALPLRKIQFASLKGSQVAWVGEVGAGFELGQAAKLRQKLNASLVHERFQLVTVVGEEIEAAGGSELL